MPFLIFLLVGGFGKSVLVGEVHVCEVPQQLGCVVVPVAVLTKEMTDEVPFDDRLLCVCQSGNDFHPLFLVQWGWLVFDTAKRIMLPLQSGKHGEINHAVFVLRERAFGIVVLADNLLRVGNGLFDGKLFETLVPFLQCPDSDGGGFLPVYLHVTEFGFRLSYLYIGLYPAFLLHAVKFLHLSGVFLVSAFKGLYRLFVLLRLGEPLFLRCFGGFWKFPCRHVVVKFLDFMPFLVQFL